ncbi:MAG TPA: protein-methionine-sulfoxide reductase heme-binding subunit MsrQ [Bacteroidota bacterium]|nr:protein-methionine-sulfoxide reductase heme-binding subunit MsrQ [Bacteroidota bacterium]
MKRKYLKPILFVLSLFPLFLLGWDAYTGSLSANPISDITHATGDWTLRFLLITLAVTPIRKITGWSEAIHYRRMFGLLAFFYGFLHLMTYVWLDQFFDWGSMLHDVGKRRFIFAGLTAFVLLIPLAVTSTKRMVRWLGGKRWQLLHRLIYLSAISGVVHYFWLVKADLHLPIRYGIILALLLGFRLWMVIRKRMTRRNVVLGGVLAESD